MYYIEQHTNPKIIKLGIRFALYREKKPEIIKDCHGSLLLYKCEMGEWQKSFIAYLKEPGFKVGEVVYCEDQEWELIEIFKLINSEEIGYNLKIDNRSTLGQMKFKTTKLNEITHYYPGQQVGSFKYVREGHICPICSRILGTGLVLNNYCNACHKTYYTDFKTKWQEVEEPEKLIIMEDLSQETFTQLVGSKIPNPEYTQFQEDKDKGLILAIIKI